jgi:hypothetical protein
MKSILYVGATLMIGASIYGFVDYKKTSHSSSFTGMYESKKTQEPVTIKTNQAFVIEEKTDAVVSSRKVAPKKEAVTEDEVIGKTKIDVVSAEKIETDPIVTETASLKDNGTTEKYKKVKKRKLSTKSFSRAPLREEREIVELPVPAKVETKKTRSKEQ